MRLEKIVLDGFKSFADRTEFVFDAPVTAIVGPNGCGKSNIVDAVKWVLGEQSVKSLRSDQMADVIFSGSSSRKALGAAEVSLFISNPGVDGVRELPIDADVVQITRKIYRSGESEYRINNKVCRLKDIRELFMDTGIGTRAYSILEQGQVDHLVSASKIERRAIFEEAAGISKYKAHKKEALRRLERTEQNLLRLADILGEVSKRLRSVKLQAGKARNYLEYTRRLKELQVTYSLAEYSKIHGQIEQRRANLEQVCDSFEAISTEVAREDSRLSSLAEQITETERALSELANALVSVQGGIEQRLQRIEFLQSRVRELEQRRASATERTAKLQEQRKVFEHDCARYEQELRRCEEQLSQQRSAIGRIRRQIDEVNAEYMSLQAHLEDEKSGIIDIVRRTAQLHNEIQSISVYRTSLANQKDRLADRAETARAELEKFLAEKAQHNARLDDIESVLEQLNTGLASKRKQIEQVEQVLANARQRLAHSKEARSALNSELALLSDMEKRREGLTAGVKYILRNRLAGGGRFKYVEGVVADIVEAEMQYAQAVEAALEGRTDAVVVEAESHLLADKEALEKLEGRVNFLCLDRIEPFVDQVDLSGYEGVRGRLVEFVRFEPRYAPLVWALLGRTILVENLEAAVKLRAELGREYQFVSLDGQYLGQDGTVRLGPVGKAGGLISRKSRLRQLNEAIAKISCEIETLEREIQNNEQNKAHLEQLCKELRTAIYEANTEKMQVGSNLRLIEQEIERLRKEEPVIASEMDLLEEQIARSVQKEYESKQRLQELEAVNKERTARIKELEQQCAERKQRYEQLNEQLTDLKVAYGQVGEQTKALKQILEGLQAQMRENLKAEQAAEQEIESCERQMAEVRRGILTCEAEVSELFVEKEQKQQASGTLRRQLESLVAEQHQLRELVRAKRSEKEQLEQCINEMRIELSQLEVKRQDLVERVRDELQIELEQAYKDYKEQEVDWEKVRQEIAELRGKIERLGNVNLDAIDEQKALEKRHEFLSSQVEDLNKSRAQLQQLIARLNRKSREKFVATFEEIRGHFQEIFRKLFGGGKADIVLEDSEDVLEAGIEIIARPPGKEPRSISLLSGGEKSLTALALLFAVFKSKPSPFCFLDEVDAALDEANNERFNMLVREFQKHSQFIIVTHAKRTMSIADVLVGITMQQRGVSKKISVRFGEYEEQAAAVA